MEAFLSSSNFGIIVFTITIINFIALTYFVIKSKKVEKEYKAFMNKLGKGENLDELIKKYIIEVEYVKNEVISLDKRCTEVEKNLEKCIQKIGIIRYNPYGKTGSDLCFALTLLDFENNGVVINGVYSRDNTTATYAKPIINGESKYTLTREEQESLNIAQNSGYKYYMKVS